MPIWSQVLFWWLAFAATHSLLSSKTLRPTLVDKLGGVGFMLTYSVIAFATFVPLVRTYFAHKHSGPWLWNLRDLPGIEIVVIALAGLAFALIVASYFNASPAGLIPAAPEPRGLLRITRHPLMTGIAVWALSHLLINASLTDVVFFGGFVVFAIAGSVHQDSRKRDHPRLAAFFRRTSLVPFAAVLAGRNRLAPGELPWLGLALGLGVAALVYAAHFWL